MTGSDPDRPRLSWGLRGRGPADIPVAASWGDGATADWLWGGQTSRTVKVCVVDSGVEPDHPLVGPVRGSYVVVPAGDGFQVEETAGGDVCGHGTACAGIIREVAPDADIYSVRVLGEGFTGSGDVLLAGLRWAIRQGFDVVNLSLSTTRQRFAADLHEIADEAFFRRTAIVASAHNAQVVSFPWRFSSVISVGSHEIEDPELYLYNPEPPVEFFAHGQNVTVAWPGGGTIRSTGNSFATPRIAGLCARALANHPELTIFQLKTALYLAAGNVSVTKRGA
ncbi:S8 family serine peptidase [Phytohabitans sp. ZYX-F-186]|uniref:S8 family serine peptidase n=1 Tax=Phytohabitans maris TaxID=3071409 RepID=A0ABU0ZWK5_9ACTN|nr:S8 family serine peptidase [Phytohabitans sp. ZYX-F-186]MDQ7911318.1 S8 family serine peptidase [Phytohabitans sp. ZYX-F-186]